MLRCAQHDKKVGGSRLKGKKRAMRGGEREISFESIRLNRITKITKRVKYRLSLVTCNK